METEQEILRYLSEIDSFDLYDYIDLIDKYGKKEVNEAFIALIKMAENKKLLRKKFYVAFLSMDLEKNKFNDIDYYMLIKKYSLDMLFNYFYNLLIITDNRDDIMQKYAQILDRLFVNNKDLNLKSRTFFNSKIGDNSLTEEEEKQLFTRLKNIKLELEIASIKDDTSEIVFNDINSVLRSINSTKQIKMLLKIKDKVCSDDKYLIDKFISLWQKEENSREEKGKININGLLDSLGISFDNRDNIDSKTIERDLSNINELFEIRKKLFEANIDIVFSIVNSLYKKGRKESFLKYDDFIEEGNIALLKAINTFDNNKNCKFFFYASSVIKNILNNFENREESLIRIPDYRHREALYLKKAFYNLWFTLNRQPTLEEMEEYTNFSSKKIEVLSKDLNMMNVVSLDNPLEELSLNEIGTFDTDEIDEREWTSNVLEAIFDTIEEKLTDREKLILLASFGFFSDNSISNSSIASDLGMTREGVRFNKNSSIKKIKKENYKLAKAYYSDK